MAYSGPGSNVRVERISCNCLNDGGALAEVISLYEEGARDIPNATHFETNLDIKRGRDDSHGIEVCSSR